MRKQNFVFIMLMLFGFSMGFAQKSAQFRTKSSYHNEKATKEIIINDASPNAQNSISIASENKAMWDIEWYFNALAAAQPGIETNGTYIYTATWNGANYDRYAMDGTHVATFTVTGTSAVRDMAFDGTYFYGAAANMSLYKMDLDNATLVSTIPATCSGVTGIRHITYDPTLDGGNGGFWIGNWAELGAIAMDGSQLIANIAGNADCYGSAYDPYSDPANPRLLLFQQGGSGVDIVAFDINTQTYQGVVHSADDIPGFLAGSIAGGACTYEDMVSGKALFIGNIQQDPNLVFAYELASLTDPSAPEAPDALVVTPDAGGALSALVEWENPDSTFNGAVLADLDSVVLFVDDVPVYSNTSPTIGGMESETVVIAAAGNHDFKVVGYNDAGNGLSSVVTAYVGEDVPEAPANVVLAVADMDITLTWDAPAAGLNGGYFSGAGIYYDVYRNGSVLVADDITATTFTETVTAGNYSYDVVAFNASGEGGTGTSNTLLVGDFLIFEEFDGTSATTWSVIGDGSGNWSNSATANAGGTAPELMFSWSPSFTGASYYTSNVINTSAFIDLNLEFTHFVNYYAAGTTVGVYTTSDGGATWNEAWSVSPTGDIGPETQTLSISTADVGSETFQIAVAFLGVSFDIDYWYVDNFYLSGGTPAVGADITFSVTDGTDPLEGANVNVNGNDFLTDVNGEVTMFLPEGDNDYTVTLFGYEDYTGMVTVVDSVPDVVDVVMVAIPGYDVTFNIENILEDALNADVTVYFEGNEVYSGTAAAGTLTFEDVPMGDYTYDVEFEGYIAVMGDSLTVDGIETVDVELLEDMIPVSSLAVEVNGFDAELTWLAPGAASFDPTWIHYDDGANADGIGTGGAADYDVAIRFLPADIAEFDGGVITKVMFWPKEAAASYTIKIWQGADAANLIYSEAVAAPSIDTYNEITLATPVAFDVAQELWIGYNINTTTGYPAGCDAGPAVVDFGDMIYFEGAWASMATAYGLDYNWNIQGYVDAPTAKAFLGTFNVYLDGDLQTASPITDLFYTFDDLTVDSYTAGVTALYTTGESEVVEVDFDIVQAYTVTFTVTDTAGAAIQDAEIAINSEVLTTDVNGVATIDLVDGAYPYTVTADGYEDETGTATVAGAALPIAIEMEPEGINDIAKAQFKVYPTPTTGLVTLVLNGKYNVKVLNVTGNVVMEQVINNKGTLNLSEQSSGIYFIQISSNEGVYTKRIVVE